MLKLTKEDIEAINPDAYFAIGLDAAIIGIGHQCNAAPVVIYDYDKCVKILMKDNDWDYEAAMEWMEFNVVGTYIGEGMPIFMTVFSEEEE